MNIAVWCGSVSGNNPLFAQEAAALGAWIAQQGHTLVFGASGTGLMRELSDACLEAGGKVHGVSVKTGCLDRVVNPRLTSVEVLATMADRKARMIEMADAIIALPGGMGTLDELTDCLVLARLELRHFPCILFNVAGYYDKLESFFRVVQAEGFGGGELSNLHLCNTLEEIGDILGQKAKAQERRNASIEAR